jgi:hypothetical protein
MGARAFRHPQHLVDRLPRCDVQSLCLSSRIFAVTLFLGVLHAPGPTDSEFQSSQLVLGLSFRWIVIPFERHEEWRLTACASFSRF